MADGERRYTGGCLCGAVRYEAVGEPLYAGYCYCADCRKASGSGFIPFIGFSSHALRVVGQTVEYRSKALRGGDAVRNSCPVCGGLVFGGVLGVSTSHTVYAGTLDEPAGFRPTIAIFERDRPDWVPAPAGLTVFETLPG